MTSQADVVVVREVSLASADNVSFFTMARGKQKKQRQIFSVLTLDELVTIEIPSKEIAGNFEFSIDDTHLIVNPSAGSMIRIRGLSKI